MFLPLVLLLLTVAGELLLGWRPLWRFRKVLAPLLGGLLLLATISIIRLAIRVDIFAIYAIGISLVSIYSFFNLARVVAGRSSEQYLQQATSITFQWLGLAHVLLAGAMLSMRYLYIPYWWYVIALAAVQLIVAVVVLWSTRRQLRTTRLPSHLPELSDGHLPTITVALPVRNEAEQLEACLTLLLASDYPKLEILAFDDQSSDHTSEVIRRFAHAGVRFISADADPEGWLAKNRAYDQLAASTSGELLLFCGTDIRVEPHTLRQLAALMTHRHKDMLVVLPQSRQTHNIPLLQAMRYYWEIAPPRRFFHRPPVLSSCWLIKRQVLEKAGGFAAVRRSISPEAHLARYTAAAEHGDAYSFVRSNSRLGVWSDKPAHEQKETAIFRRYPQVHRRPEMVLVFSLGQALLLLGLPVVAVLALASLAGLAGVIALVALALHSRAFGMIQRSIFPQVRSWRAYAALLPCIAQDIWFLHYSMYRYEFGDVTWKGRDIAQPVMRRQRAKTS